MKLFTHAELQGIQDAREGHWKVASICAAFPDHTRDEIVEAIYVLARMDTIRVALERLNHILVMQDAGEPLINGRPARQVEGRTRASPMF